MNSPSRLGPLSETFVKTLKMLSMSCSLAHPIFLTCGHKAFSTCLCSGTGPALVGCRSALKMYGICQNMSFMIQRREALTLVFQMVPRSLGWQPSLATAPSSPQRDASSGVPLAHHSYNSKKGACMRRPPEDHWISGQSQHFPFGSRSRNWLESARLLLTFPSLQTKILCSIKKQKTSQACSEKVTWLRPFPLWEHIGAGLPTGVAT